MNSSASAAKEAAPGPASRGPVPRHSAEGIDKHIASHGTTSDGYLFQGRRHKHVTRRTYQEDFARAAEKAGLPPEFIPHSLRHCYASAALARGIPITEVSRWLGHRSIEVTHQIYGTSSPPPGTRPEPSSRTPAGPAGASHRRKTRAESVLTPGRPAGHLPAVTTPRSTMMQIFEGLTRIAA